MAPKHKKRGKAARGGKGNQMGFPEMPKQGPNAQADTRNEELEENPQKQEIIVIENSYPEGFQAKDAKKGPWNQLEEAFTVVLTSQSIPEARSMSFALTVDVTLPGAYPKTAPNITLALDAGLHKSCEDAMMKTVKRVVADRLKSASPEPYIVYEVLQQLQEDLDKAAANKAKDAKLPSLEEQRLMQVEELEKKKAQDEAKKAKEEKERQVVENANERLLAKNARREASEATQDPQASQLNSPTTIAPQDSSMQEFVLDFAKTMKLADINHVEHNVRQIKQHQFYARGPVSDCYTVVPDMAALPLHCLIVKRYRIQAHTPSTIAQTGDVATIDKVQKDIKRAVDIAKGSPHTAKITAFDIRNVLVESASPALGETWKVEILMEHCSRGSLCQFLTTAKELTSSRACELGLEILEGLAYIHGNGIIHRDLHASNILLAQTRDGTVVAKIADIAFQDTIHRMTGVRSDTQRLSIGWVPPELRDKNPGLYTTATDIWFYGIILLQMLFGLDVTDKYNDIDHLLAQSGISPSLDDLAWKVFQPKATKRAGAMELMSCSYFTENNGVDEDSNTPRRRNSSMVLSTRPNLLHFPDRFKQEFTEIAKLGKGGFGEVVQARKRLDGQLYAVKKIIESDDMPFDETVKEVHSISSLHSLYVVRYFNSWVQEEPKQEPIASRFSIDDTESESSKPVKAQQRQHRQAVRTALSQSLDFVAQKSPLSKGMSFANDPDDGSETGYEDNTDDEVTGPHDDSDSDEDENDETNAGAYTPKGSFNVQLDSNPFDSNPFESDSQNTEDPNEHAITDSENENKTDITRILYIQMELCKGGNLRTAIDQENLSQKPQEITRILRQVLEGLKYVHSKKQIHRDLKPENIFFDSPSTNARTIRIGDFGLAAMGIRERLAADAPSMDDKKMTGQIGTAWYIAPEVKAGLHYTCKADMYSLGIILFELCHAPFRSQSERAMVLTKLRQPEPEFPDDFNTAKLGGLDKIILKLLTHNQEKRPHAADVLASGDLPDSLGIDVITGTLSHLTDPKSVFYRDFVEAMLSRPQDNDYARTKSLAWDLKNTGTLGLSSKEHHLHPGYSVMRCIVKDELTRIFRHHGGLDSPRAVVFPVTKEDESNSIARLVGSDGTILQLRYDLTISLARSVATLAPELQKLEAFGGTIKFYAIGDSYRQETAALKPVGEAAFDIVSNGDDLSIKEAEVMKVLEEITSTFPCLAGEQICFNINHSDILHVIFDHCGVQPEHRDVAIDNLAQLSVGDINWITVERALAEKGLSKTSVVGLHDFIFRDPPASAFSTMEKLLRNEPHLLERLKAPITHIKEVIHYLTLLGVTSTILIAPLGCAKEKLCRGGLTFSCQVGKMGQLLAAGGRYDSLIRKFVQKDEVEPALSHAVGFGLAWDKLTERMWHYYQAALAASHNGKTGPGSKIKVPGIWKTKRCDVLVCSYDQNVHRSEALILVNDLWSNGISAELACEADGPNKLISNYREDSHYFYVIIKPDKSVKIRTIGQESYKNGELKQKKSSPGDCTVKLGEVVPKLKSLIRDRESTGMGSGSAHHAVAVKKEQLLAGALNDAHITMVQPDHIGRKGKGTDRVRSNVQTASMNMLQQMAKDVQTFAVDLATDNELEKIQDLPLNADTKWAALLQKCQPEVKLQLTDLRVELQDYRPLIKSQGRPRQVIIYNQRTGNTFFYNVAMQG